MSLLNLTLPRALYTAAQTRELDRLAMEGHGLGGGKLMERAGQAAFQLLRGLYPRAQRIALVCGPGNNGGDGFVVARLCRQAGLQAQVLLLAQPERLRGDALRAYQGLQATSCPIVDFDTGLLAEAEVIVDALLGTGLDRPVTGQAALAITAMNTARAPVLALDIPSGLQADTGKAMGVAVVARTTISFIGLNPGLLTGEGPELSGDVVYHDLDVPAAVFDAVMAMGQRLDVKTCKGLMPARPRHAHKGLCGRVAVLGGDQGMAGAVMLAAQAAYRCGAGLVNVATHPAHARQLDVTLPEAMALAVSKGAELRHQLQACDVLLLGPGLGRGDWARGVIAEALTMPGPKVIDADGLYWLAQAADASAGRAPECVLTPHPGEAATLLGTSIADVQADRPRTVQTIAQQYGAVCVLKGAGTLIAHPDAAIVALCDAGNPGLATGGSGDVLAGAIASLMAQGLSGWEAARLAVWLHGTAADRLIRDLSEPGLMASDLPLEMAVVLGDVSV